MAFQCVIVTPERQLLDEKVEQVIVPAHDGEMGVLTDRAPMLTQLGVGKLRADTVSGASKTYYVEGGVVQMNGDKLTVLTDKAIPVEELSAAAAQKELADATAAPADQLGRTAAIQRAQAKVRLATAK